MSASVAYEPWEPMIEFSPCDQGWRRCNCCNTEGVQLVNVIFRLNNSKNRTSVITLCEGCCHELQGGSATAMRSVFKEHEVSKGWAYPLKRTKVTKFHYFVGATSLCKRYEEKVLALSTGAPHAYECCTQCFVKAKKHDRT